MLRIEVACADGDQLGEGPLWDVDEQRLYWLDSYGPAIHRMEPDGAKKTWTLPEPIGSLVLRCSGGAILALRSGFFTFDFSTGEAKRICETQPGELRPRLNDGKADRQGRFVAGSMDFEERAPVGKLFHLDADLSVHTLDEGIICSNGPCWSPDGRTLYFADTGRRAIYAYDYDTTTGHVHSRRLFASFETLRGLPATVDEEGYLWGRLIRFNPMGVIDPIIGLPVQSTTSLTFGGANLDIVYVTSMARPMNGQYHREREASCLFEIHGLGVGGLPEPRFAG